MRKQRGGTELSEWHHSAVGLCSQAGHVTGRSDRVSQQLQNICWFAAVPRFMSQVLPYNQNCPQVPKATYSFLKSSVLQTQLCALWFFFFFFNISLPSFISNHVHLDLDLKCLPGLWLPELFPSVPNSSWFRNRPSTSQHIGAQPEPLPVPHQALTSLLDLVPHHKLCLRTRQSWQTLPWWDATVRCPWVAGPQWEMGCQADDTGQHGKPEIAAPRGTHHADGPEETPRTSQKNPGLSCPFPEEEGFVRGDCEAWRERKIPEGTTGLLEVRIISFCQ